VDSLPCKRKTQQMMLGEEVEALPLKRKKSSRNKEHIEDGSKKEKNLNIVKWGRNMLDP